MNDLLERARNLSHAVVPVYETLVADLRAASPEAAIGFDRAVALGQRPSISFTLTSVGAEITLDLVDDYGTRARVSGIRLDGDNGN